MFCICEMFSELPIVFDLRGDRHGESQWNLENRFTGWYNIQLSPKGEQEAAEGGKLIHEAGYTFGMLYSRIPD